MVEGGAAVVLSAIRDAVRRRDESVLEGECEGLRYCGVLWCVLLVVDGCCEGMSRKDRRLAGGGFARELVARNTVEDLV